jgi:tetratricopeptide (TPR) repeat protein
VPEPPDSYVHRAELLADLGRYDEAAAELVGARPGDVVALTLLSRIRLVAGSPAEALAAADAAVAAAPADLAALIARGMALADLGRIDEAAAQAEQILRRGRDDGYACTSAAAILAIGRAGQVALDAAWEGVRLAPDQPRAHLVLGVVASRLGLKEIAERAYQEALALDPRLRQAPAAAGIVRAEQQRYATALSHFGPRRRPAPGRSRPRREGNGPPAGGLSRLLRLGVGGAVAAPLLVTLTYGYGVGAPQLAVLLAAAGLAVGWVAWRRLPAPDRAGLPELLRADRSAAVVVWAVLAVPVLLLGFGLLGSPWPLLVAVVAGIVALFANHSRLAA